MNSTNKHPLQTEVWANFRKKWGNDVAETPFGYLTLHKLPFISSRIAIFEKGPKPTKKMVTELKEFAKKENLFFIKLEPNVEKDETLVKNLKAWGLVFGKTLFTPTTFWIDLTKSEDDLLKSFSSKTRYNIRLAERSGVSVTEDNSDEAFNKYLELTRETTQRDKFYAHSEKYHRLMWETLKPAGIAHLLVAKYNNEIVTTWILFTSHDFLYYPYGASTHKYKNIMANNLVMWKAIKFGKSLGLKTFDLWGREPGKGFTRFKEGYNPKVVEFIGTWDLPINKALYWQYRIAEFIRWQVLKIKSKFIKPSF
ncbi:MAG: peptidoglycan bridge formation glycyltransferase FemA/FemB family protein [Patescibacteria group bacterium]